MKLKMIVMMTMTKMMTAPILIVKQMIVSERNITYCIGYLVLHLLLFELVRMLLQILARYIVCFKWKSFKKKRLLFFPKWCFLLSMLFSLLIILILHTYLAFQFLNLNYIACWYVLPSNFIDHFCKHFYKMTLKILFFIRSENV